MPSVTKTKLNKGALIALLFFLLIGCACLLPILWWQKVIIAVALIALFLFIRRGFILFYKAAVKLKKENTPEVWTLMKKALAAHVDDERTVLICTAFIQQDDYNFGVEYLENFLTKCKDSHWHGQAIIALSMGYWMQGKLDKAIEVLQDLKSTGYVDGNLQINLETYLLEKGDLKEAKKLITESRKLGGESNGLMDNRGLYYLLTGDWTKADSLYEELINERNAKFPEAYVHAAQVKIHLKKVSEAIDRLGWALSKRFTNTSSVSKEFVEKLLQGLENPATTEAFTKLIDEQVRAVALGQDFEGLGAEPVAMPKPELEKAEEVELSEPDESEDEINIVLEEDDDRDPNTDLTEEDFVESSRFDEEFSQELSDLNDIILNTDVDDDDREPNTDLNEDDE